MSDHVYAPFSPEQVRSLNDYQAFSQLHAFTCGNDRSHPLLFAEVAGWWCAKCDYRQNWAHRWMADWSWTERLSWAESRGEGA